MTPEQIEFHRKRFEEYWQKEIMDKLHPMFNSNSVKLKDEKRSQWEGWIKSIEGIEIEFPPVDYGLHIMASAGQQAYQEKVIEFIQSLGLKIKE